ELLGCGDYQDQGAVSQLERGAAGKGPCPWRGTRQVFRGDTKALPGHPIVSGAMEIAVGITIPVENVIFGQFRGDKDGAVFEHTKVRFGTELIEEWHTVRPAAAAVGGTEPDRRLEDLVPFAPNSGNRGNNGQITVP